MASDSSLLSVVSSAKESLVLSSSSSGILVCLSSKPSGNLLDLSSSVPGDTTSFKDCAASLTDSVSLNLFCVSAGVFCKSLLVMYGDLSIFIFLVSLSLVLHTSCLASVLGDSVQASGGKERLLYVFW